MIFGKKEASQTASVMRCSFCNKADKDVRKLIAGPHVFICDECIQACNDILADDARAASREEMPREPPGPAHSSAGGGTVSCVLCSLPILWEDALFVHERGALCPGCVGEIEAAAAERHEKAE